MFWENFYEACKNNNTTPNAVCSALGLSNATATGWKKRGVSPSGEILSRIADYLNCSTDYLLGRTDMPNAEKPASAKGDGQSEIYDIIESLSSDNRAKLLELARLFLDAQRKSEENG